MDRSQLVIAFLGGVCVALGVALVLQSGDLPPKAYGQATATGDFFVVTGTGTQGQSRDVLFMLDTRSTRLAVFEYKDGRLSLGAVRNVEYDLRFEEWSPRGKKQEPPVKEQRKATEEGDKPKGPRRK